MFILFFLHLFLCSCKLGKLERTQKQKTKTASKSCPNYFQGKWLWDHLWWHSWQSPIVTLPLWLEGGVTSWGHKHETPLGVWKDLGKRRYSPMTHWFYHKDRLTEVDWNHTEEEIESWKTKNKTHATLPHTQYHENQLMVLIPWLRLRKEPPFID